MQKECRGKSRDNNSSNLNSAKSDSSSRKFYSPAASSNNCSNDQQQKKDYCCCNDKNERTPPPRRPRDITKLYHNDKYNQSDKSNDISKRPSCRSSTNFDSEATSPRGKKSPREEVVRQRRGSARNSSTSRPQSSTCYCGSNSLRKESSPCGSSCSCGRTGDFTKCLQSGGGGKSDVRSSRSDSGGALDLAKEERRKFVEALKKSGSKGHCSSGKSEKSQSPDKKCCRRPESSRGNRSPIGGTRDRRKSQRRKKAKCRCGNRDGCECSSLDDTSELSLLNLPKNREWAKCNKDVKQLTKGCANLAKNFEKIEATVIGKCDGNVERGKRSGEIATGNCSRAGSAKQVDLCSCSSSLALDTSDSKESSSCTINSKRESFKGCFGDNRASRVKREARGTRDSQNPVKTLVNFCEKVKAMNRSAVDCKTPAPESTHRGSQSQRDCNNSSLVSDDSTLISSDECQCLGSSTVKTIDKSWLSFPSSEEGNSSFRLRKVILHSPEDDTPPLTLYRSGSDLECKCEGDINSGYQYRATYTQMFKSTVWYPGGRRGPSTDCDAMLESHHEDHG